MNIGVVREVKEDEYRVAVTPPLVRELVAVGAQVLIESGAGVEAGFLDDAYIAAGAEVAPDSDEVYAVSDLIVKVKEPQPEEYHHLQHGSVLFAYLHLAADSTLADELCRRRVTGIAYETIEDERGGLPCLRPMSAIAGRLSIQEGAKYLERPFGGRGVLLSGLPGVQRGRVTILGAGVVGQNACRIAVGMGAEVTILDIDVDRLVAIEQTWGSRVQTLMSNETNLDRALREADLMIGAVLRPGWRAPALVRREHLSRMKHGAVIVDVAVDQGGCVETTRATTHRQPTFVVDSVVHYCVTNMPGAVARTSTEALVAATGPYLLQLATQGPEKALRSNRGLGLGLNTFAGDIVHEGVARSLQQLN